LGLGEIIASMVLVNYTGIKKYFFKETFKEGLSTEQALICMKMETSSKETISKIRREEEESTLLTKEENFSLNLTRTLHNIQ
jgi:hypothetical protein